VNEPRNAESVAARLRFLRGSLGLSQEQLARRLGVSFATVNRWESGRTQLSARALTAVAELEAEYAEIAVRAGGSSSANSTGVITTGSAGAIRPTAPSSTSPSTGPSASTASTTTGSGGPSSDVIHGSPADQLPVSRSSFVGRDHELAELTALITGTRLVTLIGPGGAGKTRLATELINRSFTDSRIVFVALERVRPPRTVASALASRLRVQDQHDTPLIESIRGALATGPHLLLLDGAERLADQVAELTTALLESAPELSVIITSRVVLGIDGEVCWTVPPLACPSVTADAADIAASDAVQLFIARASERMPDFRASDVAPHAIAELCRRLDGLPLAIELIAGWVGTLSIREILQQRSVLLDSEPTQTGQRGGRRLADVLRVSYDLLTPDQQRRLAMLSAFAGSFRLDDVQAVLGIDALTAAETTRLLVDSSWLVVTRGPEQNLFGMLETVRTFAAVQLEQTGDGPAVRRRHAQYWAAIAAGSEQGLAGPDAGDWTRRLEVAVADLHVALHWADEQNDVDLGLDISASLWRWWLVSGRLAVGRNWLARFLTLAGQRSDERVGRALSAAAVLAAENGDYPEAIRTAELAMAIFEPLGLKLRMTLAATVLGSAHRYLGNTEGARRGFQTAMRLREEIGDRRGMSVAINNMALLELDAGNIGQARELFEQALAIKREFGERRSIAIGLANLADVLIRTGDWDEADRALHEGAGMSDGNPQLIGTIRCNQGMLAALREDWAGAAEHFRAAIAASQAGGHPHDTIEAMIGLGRVCYQTGQHDEALSQLRSAQALAVTIGNAQRIAQAEAALAEVSGAPGADLATAVAPPRAERPGNLTARQAEVLSLLAAGLSNKQIAAQLYLSAATVERHLATIYRNLGLAGRVEAARFAIEHGLAETAQPGAGRPERHDVL
jgi:predicted ATPase/DNA-binding NarL/FixJ family response regulator/DNA-binding XRE family transcriptional regulator